MATRPRLDPSTGSPIDPEPGAGDHDRLAAPEPLPDQPPLGPELEAADRPEAPSKPSELMEHPGVRPLIHNDNDLPRPLRTPTSPQREHIMAEAEALRRYVESGGPVDYFRANRPGGRKRVGFVVDRDRFNRIRAEIRAEQTGNHPWIWQPKRGLHRSSSGS